MPDAIALGPTDSISLNPKTPEEIAKAKRAIESGVLPAEMFLDCDDPTTPKGFTISVTCE